MTVRPNSDEGEGRSAAPEPPSSQAEKTAAVVQLAGGIAHDFNNLLMTILGNSEMLTAKLAVGTPAHEMAALIEEAAQRAAELTRQLLIVARRQLLRPRAIEVDRFVDGLMDRFRGIAGAHIAVELARRPALRPALADPAALETAVVNLIDNARDAMPDGGRLLIEVGVAAIDETQARQAGDAAAGSYVTIAVTDSGTGLSPDAARRIFDPYASRTGGKGRGLGLSMVDGFVRQSGGHVTLASAPGMGTTVTIHLPSAP